MDEKHAGDIIREAIEDDDLELVIPDEPEMTLEQELEHCLHSLCYALDDLENLKYQVRWGVRLLQKLLEGERNGQAVRVRDSAPPPGEGQ